jgi:hypothetical protein
MPPLNPYGAVDTSCMSSMYHMHPVAPLQNSLSGEAAVLAREHPVALFPVVLDIPRGLTVHVPVLSHRHRHDVTQFNRANSRTEAHQLSSGPSCTSSANKYFSLSHLRMLRYGLTSKICRWLLPDGPRTLFHGSKVSFTPGPVQ